MRLRVALIAAAVLLVTLYSTIFTVHQTRQALVLQFGDPRQAIQEPGLHFKIPFIQNVVYIDRRILNIDITAEEVIAADQKRLVVDAFARYRITDPLKFYQTLQNRARIDSRLTALVSSNTRSVLGKQSFTAVVRDRRATLMREIRDLVNGQANDFGIEIVDVRIRRADLPEANSQAIFRRMQTERQQEAAEIRAIGQRDARQIRARADKDAAVILASAYRDAEIIRGQGEGCRNRIFASAFGQDAEFFTFYRSMQSYERALESGGTSLVLSPDSEFFRFLLDPDKQATNPARSAPTSQSRQTPSAAPPPFRPFSTADSMRAKLCPEIEILAQEDERAAGETRSSPVPNP